MKELLCLNKVGAYLIPPEEKSKTALSGGFALGESVRLDHFHVNRDSARKIKVRESLDDLRIR